MKSFNEVVEFHGHSCPGLAIGYRVATAVLREMGMGHTPDEEVVAVVENDSCAVDAIQVITGCTFGKGNLIFKDYGKQVYTFAGRPSGEGVRVSAEFPSEDTEEEREMLRRYSEGDRSEDVLRVVQGRKERKTEAILNASENDLLRITKVRITLPPEAEIYPTIRCGACGEGVAEAKARIRGGKAVCVPCIEGEP